MIDLVLSLISAILIGLGATLAIDLWAHFLKLAFKIAAPNYCLVGRWLRSMPEGIFKHSNISVAPEKNAECAVGLVAHYMIGVIFAILFIAFAGNNWLRHPTLPPAFLFGVVTILAPFFIMQPAFGIGIAASKSSNPKQARVCSLMNHTSLGIGLYLSGFWSIGCYGYMPKTGIVCRIIHF